MCTDEAHGRISPHQAIGGTKWAGRPALYTKPLLDLLPKLKLIVFCGGSPAQIRRLAPSRCRGDLRNGGLRPRKCWRRPGTASTRISCIFSESDQALSAHRDHFRSSVPALMGPAAANRFGPVQALHTARAPRPGRCRSDCRRHCRAAETCQRDSGWPKTPTGRVAAATTRKL
jgi:hypothetical protein